MDFLVDPNNMQMPGFGALERHSYVDNTSLQQVLIPKLGRWGHGLANQDQDACLFSGFAAAVDA